MPVSAARGFDAGSWQARLALDFGAGPGGTALLRREHVGPLCVQKPFHPGDGSCHVYVLHPPGGLAGGDRLELIASVAAEASALVTMPASTKFYRSTGREASVVNRLAVAAGARLEWLPPETILFGGSRARLGTEVRLARSAVFIGWEILALGRTLSGDLFTAGAFEQRLDCFVDDVPILLERTAAAAGDPVLSAPFGLHDHPYSATLLAWPANPDTLEAAREAIGDADYRHGATVVDGLLVLRISGPNLPAIRSGLEAVWQALAPTLLGRPALPPRIWQT
jgi:urease accessory protein